jgi:hypothetical protein
MLTAGKDGRVTLAPGPLGDALGEALGADGVGSVLGARLGTEVAAAEQAAARAARRTMNASGPLMGLAMACLPGSRGCPGRACGTQTVARPDSVQTFVGGARFHACRNVRPETRDPLP